MRKKTLLLLTVFLSLSLGSIVLNAQTYTITDPLLLEKKQLSLKDSWAFYWQQFIDPVSFNETDINTDLDIHNEPVPDAIISAPWLWNAYAKDGKGFATYRLCVQGLKPLTRYGIFLFDKIGTAFDLYVNAQYIISAGTPSEHPAKTISDQVMDIAFFSSDVAGKADIVIHASNDFHRKGGIWGTINIAEEEYMRSWFNNQLNQRFLFAGALFIIILYHCALFFFRKYDFASLFLSLFVLAILLRILVQGFSIAALYFPEISYAVRLKLEYTPLFLCPVFFALYLKTLYRISFPYHFDIWIVAIGTFFALAVYALPINYANRLVIPCEIYLGLSALSLLGIQLAVSFKQKQGSDVLALINIVCMIIAAVHDILIFQLVPAFLPNISLLPYSFILFVIFQSIITASQHEQALNEVELLSENLIQTNRFYFRFVPEQFLALLGKTNIFDVHLGEYTSRTLTLLCSDIRNFTSISESISAKEVFDLLNQYLQRIAPIIRENGGFIEKYLGDGIIALFPEESGNPLICALRMQQELHHLRTLLIKEHKPSLECGIGIHYGEVILGTVGESNRMNGVTVSAAVETVMLLESLCKTYQVPIIVSHAAVEHWNAGEAFILEPLARTKESGTDCIPDSIYALQGSTNTLQ